MTSFTSFQFCPFNLQRSGEAPALLSVYKETRGEWRFSIFSCQSCSWPRPEPSHILSHLCLLENRHFHFVSDWRHIEAWQVKPFFPFDTFHVEESLQMFDMSLCLCSSWAPSLQHMKLELSLHQKLTGPVLLQNQWRFCFVPRTAFNPFSDSKHYLKHF